MNNPDPITHKPIQESCSVFFRSQEANTGKRKAKLTVAELVF